MATGVWLAGEDVTAEKLNDTGGTTRIARYYQTVAQTGIAAGTATGVKFDTAQATSSDVTTNADKSLFTLLRDGWWRMKACVRVSLPGFAPAVGTEGEMFFALCPLLSNNTTRYTVANARSTQSGGVLQVNIDVDRPFTAGSTIAANYQCSMGPSATVPHTEAIFISLAWDRPLS